MANFSIFSKSGSPVQSVVLAFSQLDFKSSWKVIGTASERDRIVLRRPRRRRRRHRRLEEAVLA